jgi:hypothetical protein
MDKKIVGLLGAVAGLATVGSAQAAIHPVPNPSEALQASSYADLLAPVPNAAELLKADDAAHAQQPSAAADDFELARAFYPLYRHHHHHHHHHSYYGPYGYRGYHRRYHHHHHHHAFIGIPGIGGVVVGHGR